MSGSSSDSGRRNGISADTLDVARKVADAVLYEGYVLFPYRASALKNRYRWQWGVVIPQAQVDVGGSEPSEVCCETLVRATAPESDPHLRPPSPGSMSRRDSSSCGCDR